jgi:HAD superfamily phosphatase (TIGR01681 family)
MDSLHTKYKIVIFDFDNTLCNINLYTSFVKLDDINETNKTIMINNNIISIYNIFNDFHDISKIFMDLKKREIKLVIASFGDIKIITKIINTAFPNIFDYILTPDNINNEVPNKYIITIFRHIIDPQCPKFYGKNIMIKKIMQKFNFYDPSKILFFDDDYSNFTCATYLNINAYNNTKKGVTAKILMENIYYKINEKYNKYIIYKF